MNNKTSTLFDSDSRFRENRIIWRLFETTIMVTPLLDGQPFRWFAVNIPLDINDISTEQGDIDLIACLLNFPTSPELEPTFRYKTWEVKASLIDNQGIGHSLKNSESKLNSLRGQLVKLVDFGVPEVSLLEIYLLENANFLENHKFISGNVQTALESKKAKLKGEKVGYQILTFTHDKINGSDFGIKTIVSNIGIFPHVCNIFKPEVRSESGSFLSLVEYLQNFYNQESQTRTVVGLQIITFCKSCKRLILVPHEEKKCYLCQSLFLASDNDVSYTNFNYSQLG